MLSIILAAVFGSAWRFCDGRGWGGPTLVRHFYAAILALFALYPLATKGWRIAATVALAAVFSAIWAPRQKQREEIDDMLLRWGAPFAVYGALLAWFAGSAWPFPVLSIAGFIVALLVVWGVRSPWLTFTVRGLTFDSTAITEALSGAVAFGALAASAQL